MRLALAYCGLLAAMSLVGARHVGILSADDGTIRQGSYTLKGSDRDVDVNYGKQDADDDDRRPGGLEDPPEDEDDKATDASFITSMMGRLQNEIAAKLGIDQETSGSYQIVDWKWQLVNGRNFFVKVQFGPNYYHLRLFASFDGQTQNLVAYQPGHTATDEIEYFEGT